MTDDEELKKVFQRYQKLIFKAANSVRAETPYGFITEFSRKLDDANVNFKQLAKRYIDRAIPDTEMTPSAEEVLRKAGAFHETANVKLTTYVQMFSKLTESAEQFRGRIQECIIEDEKNGDTTTVSDLKEYIKTELKTGSGTSVRYSNGTQMPVDKYAEMLARTTRTETHNLSMLGKALDDGNDLVECSTISPTCPTCAMYQGRIYSISGNTPGYPKLYETAFKHGYSCIHPNCRHQFFPYNPKFHTVEERAQLEENTRKPFDGDPQSESVRAAYAKSQMQMRQWNKELNEFAEMQKAYSERNEEPPYKTLGAFRRAYRSEESSLAYAKSHYMRRDMRELKEILKDLGEDRAPKSLAKLQSLKYNKDSTEYEQLRREKTTIIDIKSKNNWTPQFKQKAIDTYYEFRDSNIELTDHGVARLLDRFGDKKEAIKAICNDKPFNYVQDDGKRVKHYNSIAVVYAETSNEIVTFVDRKKPKTDWRTYDTSNIK